MMLDGKQISEAERMKLLADMEREECEALEAMVPVALALLENSKSGAPTEYMQEIEKLAAADLVLRIRNLDETLLRSDDIERARLAQAARRLAAELLAGAARLDRYVPSGDPPEFLREGSAVPLPQLAKRQAG